MQTMRARPILAFLAAILALLALTGMVYALGRLTGFIPGFGFTSNTGLVYVLAEPVESTNGGITLRLDNAVSDDTRFWTTLTAKGLPEGNINAQAFVLLPDGNKLQFQEGNESATRMSFTFPALPAGTQALTLLVEAVDGLNFSLELQLRPARSGEIIPAQPTGSTPPQSEDRNGLKLVLENVAPASDKTVFQVSLQFGHPNTSMGGPWSITLSDAAGRVYPLQDITPDSMTSGHTFIYQTLPFSGNEHLTLSLVADPGGDTLPVIEDFSADNAGFRFDPGPNPQIGQSWDLNETVSVGGYKLHVVRATMTAEPGLVFEFEPAGDVTGVMLYTTDPLLQASAGSPPVQDKNFTAGLIFKSIPAQPFDVRITQVYYTVAGPWTIQWQPPAAPTPGAASPTPTEAPTSAPVTTPTPVSSDPIVLEVQALARKFDAPFQKGPGWVQVVTENITNPQAGQTYPPPYLKTELWYEIDADGYITRLLSTDRDKNGQILQQAATVGNYSINFTYGSSGFNDGKRYRVSLDNLAFSLRLAAQDTQDITQVLREQSTCENGNPCLLITVRAYFPAPHQNPGETQAYYGSVKRVWIDAQTGQQVKTETSWLLKDDKETVTSTNRVLAVEKVAAPPQEILNVLAKVVVP